MMTNEHEVSKGPRPTTKVEAPPVPETRGASGEAEVVKQTDICITCMHRLACQYRKANARPVIYCEEFEVEPTPPRPSRSTKAEPADAEATGRMKGLCMNCAHRERCKLPKPDGGVWHCEEYE